MLFQPDLGVARCRTMLSQEQLAAIVRATGQLPPMSPSLPSPQLPRLQAGPAASSPMPSQWSSLVDNHGKPLKEPSRKRGRPPSTSPTVRDMTKLRSRPTGLSQAKGVNKEVEQHFKERLNWLVEQLHRHYQPDYVDGKMYLERRDDNVRFDGVCTIRAIELPDWYVQGLALQSGRTVDYMAEGCRDRSLDHNDMTGALTAHLHGRHIARWTCAPGNRCEDCREKGKA